LGLNYLKSSCYMCVIDWRSARSFPQTWFFNCLRTEARFLAIRVPNLLFLFGLCSAGVAQLVEHLICNQRVGGSIPSASSSDFLVGVRRSESKHDNMNGLVSLHTSPFCVFAFTAPIDRHALYNRTRRLCRRFRGRVGERLKPADCKSAAPCGLRRFESFPVHQD
jgi:hypothetical protein